ncbi:MAG TPA: glycosyltransferase, partial [Dongiaceae bacterium]|nr:glycosyltransferase [Dongiaceae bacterium]
MTTQRPIVLTAGGTGGHIFPAEALAAELMARGFALALITDKRGKAFGGTLGTLPIHHIAAGGVAGRKLVARVLAFG